MIWAFGERVCAQLISTVVAIILARLLEPSMYGTVAIVTVIIEFLNVFVTDAFSTALIQKKGADELDFNSCFLLSVSVAAALYLILAIASPWIAEFYHSPVLRPIILVLGLRMPVAAVNSIQQAMIQKQMRFKSLFVATLIGTIISAIVGISMAYAGYGVWALVTQYMTNVVIDTIALFFLNNWRPKIRFSVERAKGIWSFGGKVLASHLISTGGKNIRSLIIGKVFGPEELSFYNNGQKYVSLIVDNVNSSIQKVMLPVYSERQQDRVKLLATMQMSVRVATYILTPLLFGFAIIADSFVRVILTEKWMGCIPYIRIFCAGYWFLPMSSIRCQAILATGKSQIVLKVKIITNSISLVFVFIAAFIVRNVLAIACFWVLGELISCILSVYFTNKLLGYQYRDQIKDIFPTLCIGVCMVVAVYLAHMVLKTSDIVSLLIQILSGATVYILLSHITNNKAYRYTLEKILSGFHKKI